MSIEQLKAKAAALSDEERNELIDYLLDLGRKRRGDIRSRVREDDGRNTEPASDAK